MNLSAAFEAWATATTLASTSVKKYRRTFLQMQKHGIRELEDLTREAIARFQDARRASGRSHKTINGNLDALMSVVRWLERRGEISAERVRALSGMRLRLAPPAPPDFFTYEEFDRLRRAAEKIGPWLRAAIEIGCLAGLRRGEIRRLDWRDVDIDRRVLRVMRKPDLGELGETKCYSERAVPLCPELILILRAYGTSPSGPVFPALFGRGGPHVSLDAMKQGLKELGRWVGIRATWHKMRRTFVTWSLQSEIPPTDVARWIGHRGLAVLYKHYAGWIASYNPSIERLSRRLG